MASTQYCPGIRGYSSPFNYLNPRTKELENLWPLGPIGDKRHGKQGLNFKKDSAKRALITVMTWSGSGSLADLIRDISRSVGPGLRTAYMDATLGNLCHKKLEQLVADTCFFLLLAFSILGAKLKFPDQHEYFGVGRVKRDMEKWLRSIFYVGNQIPFVLVDKLVDSLSYLKLIRDEIRRKKPPSEFLERALFEFVVYDPSRLPSTPPPVDVVHCLRSIIVGPEPEMLRVPHVAPHIQRREIQGYRPRLWEYRFYIIGLLVIIHLLWGLISDTIQSGFTVEGYYKHE